MWPMRRAPGSPEPRSEDEEGMPARGLCPGLKRCARLAACIGLGFHSLAYYEEDTGREAYVEVEPGEPCRVTLLDPSGCVEDTLDALYRALPMLVQAPLPSYELECREPVAEEGLRYRGLTLRLVSCIREHMVPCMKRLAVEPREYFAVLGWNGLYAVGPGSERAVTLPLIRSVVFGHTHPGPLCYPSWRDLRSFAEYFASGGLVEVIVSTNCAFVLRLVEPFAEDDYWALQETARCAERAEKRGSGEDYMLCLNKLYGLRSVEAGML